MKNKDNQNRKIEKIARANLLRDSSEPSGISIRGYDFNKGINYDSLLDNPCIGKKIIIVQTKKINWFKLYVA